jgi:aromatic ring-opening dioxygenase LigB subunit
MRDAGLVFAAIAPHGSIAIAAACGPAEAGLARATRRAMAELGRRFDAARPEAVIVLTPHNVHLPGAFAVLAGASAVGELEDAHRPVALECPIDMDLAFRCLAALQRAGLPALGVSFGGNDVGAASVPMDWGALIPLWYMGGRSQPPVPVVMMSPCRALSGPDHVRAGRALASAARAAGRRVALIASADHGHAHDPRGPYGFDQASRLYDERVVAMVTDNRLDRLLRLDPGLVEAAKVDSWWQLLMLHGAVGRRWQPELLSYEAPTYFGMLCAAYSPPAAKAP